MAANPAIREGKILKMPPAVATNHHPSTMNNAEKERALEIFQNPFDTNSK